MSSRVATWFADATVRWPRLSVLRLHRVALAIAAITVVGILLGQCTAGTVDSVGSAGTTMLPVFALSVAYLLYWVVQQWRFRVALPMSSRLGAAWSPVVATLIAAAIFAPTYIAGHVANEEIKELRSVDELTADMTRIGIRRPPTGRWNINSLASAETLAPYLPEDLHRALERCGPIGQSTDSCEARERSYRVVLRNVQALARAHGHLEFSASREPNWFLFIVALALLFGIVASLAGVASVRAVVGVITVLWFAAIAVEMFTLPLSQVLDLKNPELAAGWRRIAWLMYPACFIAFIAMLWNRRTRSLGTDVALTALLIGPLFILGVERQLHLTTFVVRHGQSIWDVHGYVYTVVACELVALALATPFLSHYRALPTKQ